MTMEGNSGCGSREHGSHPSPGRTFGTSSPTKREQSGAAEQEPRQHHTQGEWLQGGEVVLDLSVQFGKGKKTEKPK